MMSEAVSVKIRPWRRDIPRFEKEPSLVGVPTRAEESVFADPVAASTTNLVADYTSSKANSSSRDMLSRRLAAEVGGDADSIKKTYMHLASLRESSSRPHIYKDLAARLGKLLFASQKPYPLHPRVENLADDDIDDGLPERSSLLIPQEAIALTNACFYVAFPSEFGIAIPMLAADDIRVVMDDSFASYVRERLIEEQHPFWEENSRTPQLPDFAVMPMLPGKPIFYTASMLESINELGPYTLQAFIANSLIHENTHRIAETQRIKVKADDPLLNIALSSLSNSVYQLPEGEERTNAEAELDRIWAYVETHEPEVEIEGAAIKLYCRDGEGNMKQFNSSGYDINEAIVEILGEKVTQQLDGYIRKTHRTAAADNFISLLRSDESPTTSVAFKKIQNSQAKVYLKSLGLDSDEAILEAYKKGRIPMLHIEKFPKENYYD